MTPRLPMLTDRSESFRDALVRAGADYDTATQAIARLDEDRTFWLTIHRMCRETRVHPVKLIRLMLDHRLMPKSGEVAA